MATSAIDAALTTTPIGTIADQGSESELALAQWGYAPGEYPVYCLDCDETHPDDRILGSVLSVRCPSHAIQARMRWFVQQEQQPVAIPDDRWPLGLSLLMILAASVAIWTVLAGLVWLAYRML